jgi:pimeloyl-ACP methyl ester carboxylesterase
VRALLIVDTGPGFKNDEARADWNKYALKSADRFESEGFGSLKLQSRERALATHRSAKGLALAGRGMLTQRDAGVINSLTGVKVPSLIIVGANDTGFLKAADYMAAKIPGASKLTIGDAGHAANIDQPEIFNAAILEFLDHLPSP